MKISFNWLKKYIDFSETAEQIAQLLTHSGLEVEGVEKHESIPGGLKNYAIGKVLTCEKHPGADKLSKTTVDVGNNTILPIVCGAPNVAAGQKVIVALPGAEVRVEGKEPFRIQKTKIRGEVSEGMICAEDELGTGHSHEGILVLDTQLPEGTPASVYFTISTDEVIEIGLTPNRADAASHFGVARELKALLKNTLIFHPEKISFTGTFANPISVNVSETEACPRYAALFIKGIAVKPSPEWLQAALKSIGLHPINNVVDVTNYVLHGLGQPLHAFDAAALSGQQIQVKFAQPNTSFVTLDGKERVLQETDLVICDRDKPLALAGVFGGKDSGVSEQTTEILIESAYFHPDAVRKTAQRLGLKTDASFRFERGTNPDMVIPALKEAARLILELAGGEPSEIVDQYPQKIAAFEIKLTWKRLTKLVGEELPRERVKEILQLLEISIVQETTDLLQLQVPAYRVDVRREADVIEEILRIYGYNNIKTKPYLSSEFLAAFPENDLDKTKINLGKLLVAKGFYETYSNSLTKASHLIDESKTVRILNALSTELDVMRQSLLPSAFEVIAHNSNRRQKDVKIFEIGYVYHLNEGIKYTESQRLSIALSGAAVSESWQQPTRSVSFQDLKNVLSELLGQLGITKFSLQKSEQKWFSQAVEIIAQNKVIGFFGQIAKENLKAFDLKQEVVAAELDLDLIFSLKSKPLTYKELSKYPEVRRDLSLVIDRHVRFEEIEKLARKSEPVLLKEMNVFDVFEGESLGKDKKAYAISFLLSDENKTLTDTEIEAVMSKMIGSYEKELNALIRR